MQDKYVSIETVLSKLYRDYPIDNFSETDVIEWIGEALEAIGAIGLYEKAVAFIEVKNYEMTIPNGFHSVSQIARNYCYEPSEKQCGVCPKDVIEEVIEQTEEVHVPVPLDCYGKPIVEYELAYYRPYFDFKAEYIDTGFFDNSQCFRPVRKTNNTMFHHCKNETGIDAYTESASDFDEYDIIKGEIVRFSFEEGQVAFSYMRAVVDENGYPMIPEHYSILEAVSKYVIYKLMIRSFYSGERGSEMRMSKAEKDWQFYCKQASNYIMMPKGVDAYQNIMEQRQHMLPRVHRYYGFFGKMSTPESRKFNDPDNRNYFRGYGRRY